MSKQGDLRIQTLSENDIYIEFTCHVDINRHGGYQQVIVEFDIDSVRYELYNGLMELHFETLNDKNKELINEALDDWYEEHKYE